MRIITKPVIWVLITCLTHNPVAMSYMITGLLFFKPFPAFADAFLDNAAEGQSLGSGMISEYNIPNVNSSTGEMTLNNGLVAGQTVQQNELFQQIQPGSMDGAVASYGNSAALGTQVNSDITSLSTGTSSHADAYRTLMGANTSMPNMSTDPMWKTSDDIYSLKSPLISDLFNGCDKKTSFSETSCQIHTEDLKTCKKTLKTESCKVDRFISELTGNDKVINKISSRNDGNAGEVLFTDMFDTISIQLGIPWNNDGGSSGCYFWEYSIDINVNDPSRLVSALMTYVAADGGMSLFIDGNNVWNGNGGYGSCPDGAWGSSPNLNILPYLTQGQHTLTMRIGADNNDSPSLPDGGSFFTIKKKPDFKEEILDYPAGCRERLFDSWPPQGSAPPFISSGSLNDQASTDWWQCTDAATSRTFGSITLENTSDLVALLNPLLPGQPATPPAPICYSSTTRVPGHINLACFTDKDGYQVCPEYDYNTDAHTSCDELTANPQCFYVGEACANGAVSKITGVCQEFIVTYDCGANYPASCNQVNEGEKTICDSQIRCIGGECIDQKTESNADFIKAAAALQTMNQAQQDSNCDAASGDCALFAGEPMECQMADMSVLGSVDCCNMPIQGSWIDYMWLAQHSWMATDMSVEMYSIAQNGTLLTDTVGAWNMVSTGSVFQAPISTITETWSAVTEPFTSMYDSVATMLGETIQDIAGETISNLTTNLSIDVIKQQMTQWMGEWIASTFGETAASTLLSATSSTTASGVTTTTYSMSGSMLSSIITVVGIIYAIYQIAKMVVQLVFACTEDEMKLAMLKSQRLCTSTGEIGDYCSAETLFGCVARKEAYCCFSSPFSRVFQQQARPQLGKTFGDPKAPNCAGLSISEIGRLDFHKMDFSEWIDMLMVSNQIPNSGASANSMYDKAEITRGPLPGLSNTNSQDRINSQTQGSDIDVIRQHMLDNL